MLEPELSEETGLMLYGSRIIRFPARGRLLVSTDLHGNYNDYLQMRKHFEAAWHEHSGNVWMLFTGDLIHGPSYTEEQWPEHLGDFYTDQSEELLDDFINLKKHLGERLLTLLGNHEHSHVGGPSTHKFGRRPSEAKWFEKSAGAEKSELYREFFRTLPLVALTPCGVVVSHGAPRLLSSRFEAIANAKIETYSHLNARDMADVPVVGELLWCRSTGPLVVRRFLKTMEVDDLHHTIAIYGHDPVREGYEKASREQLCYSTSYGLVNSNKVYLELDLEKHYESVDEFHEGSEIRYLYPESR